MVPLEGGKVSEGMKVKHVMRRGLRAVHFVEIEDRDQEMLEVGKEVELKVDWERRLDLVCLSPPFPVLGPLPPFPPSPL
jgi:Ser-tRNA(Ala) deacylase AlaX